VARDADAHAAGRARGHLLDCLVALDQDAVMRLQRRLLDEE
jgi:hypothetical protein